MGGRWREGCRGSPPRMRGEPASRASWCTCPRITPAYAGRTFEKRWSPHLTGITPAYAGRTRSRAPHRRALRDHPRVCGENAAAFTDAAIHSGSPPRMRGEHGGELGGLRHQRITPAYAGRTHRRRARRDPNEDHPRVCGENTLTLTGHGGRLGSPPRMRGERCSGTPRQLRWRITPAYAGRTPIQPSTMHAPQDHPRVCGENSGLAGVFTTPAGSPPRMRGEHPLTTPTTGEGRITPAYAGRTRPRPQQSRLRGDHPRVCGENTFIHTPAGHPEGSPPRMRGEHTDHSAIGVAARITPAYAGRTHALTARTCHLTDHPRVCGENTAARVPGPSPDGSPPRMRGEPHGHVCGVVLGRITPAYAGRTSDHVQPDRSGADHPRVCGENSVTHRRWKPKAGSPPRMRGELPPRSA